MTLKQIWQHDLVGRYVLYPALVTAFLLAVGTYFFGPQLMAAVQQALLDQDAPNRLILR